MSHPERRHTNALGRPNATQIGGLARVVPTRHSPATRTRVSIHGWGLTCGSFEDQDRFVRRVGVDAVVARTDHDRVSTVEQPSYEDLAALVVALTERLVQAEAHGPGGSRRCGSRWRRLRAKSGKDSTNSSTPPSADSDWGEGETESGHLAAGPVQDRKRGGQPAASGSGLVPTVDPGPQQSRSKPRWSARGCGADLADGMDAGSSWAQVWDTLPIVVEKVHYVLPKRRCGCCRTLTTATPAVRAGGHGVLRPERQRRGDPAGLAGQTFRCEATAALMAALLGSPGLDRVRRPRPCPIRRPVSCGSVR